jgi:lactoylglutathione lyase
MIRPAHVMIQVRDLERAVDFYQKAMHLKEVERHRYDGATLVYLRGPALHFEIELLTPDSWPFDPQPETGRTHIAFTVDNLDEEHQRLKALGIAPDPITDYVANGRHQTRFFYFYDPEGNEIEFLEASGRYVTERNEPC